MCFRFNPKQFYYVKKERITEHTYSLKETYVSTLNLNKQAVLDFHINTFILRKLNFIKI